MKTRHAGKHPISKPWVCASMSFVLLQTLSEIIDRGDATFGQRISFSRTHRHFQHSFLGDLCRRIPDKSLIY